MEQPMNTNPVQVVVVAQPMMIDKQIKYRNMKSNLAEQLIGLGITQFMIGILCIIFQSVAVGMFNYQLNYLRTGYGYYISGIDYIGHGFWSGILFLITGPFGIAGGIKRSRCQVVAFNVLSIISASFAALLLFLAIPGATAYANGNQLCDYFYSGPASHYDSYYYRCYSSGMTGHAMEAMLAILGLMEVIIAIWSAAICCKIGACCCNCGGSCCCPPVPLQNQFPMGGQPLPDQQQIIIANQQQQSGSNQPDMFIPNQPSAFVPNSHQQLMLAPNQQQPIFLVNPQQPIANVDPRQQMAQYQSQPSYLPPYGQQPSAFKSLTPEPEDQDSCTGLYNSGMKDTLISPEQPRNHRDRESAYDNYDRIENGEK